MRFPKILLAPVLVAVAGSAAAQQAGSSNFGGLYGALQVGVAEARSEATDLGGWLVLNSGTNYKVSSVASEPAYGLKLGFDVVEGSIIYGALVEGAATSILASDTTVVDEGNSFDFKAGSEIKALGSIRAKYGFVSDKVSAFGTAGVALARIKNKFEATDVNSIYPEARIDQNGNRTGWVVGVGAAYALSKTTALGFDVSRYLLGSNTHAIQYGTDGDQDYKVKYKTTVDTVSLSLISRF